MGGDAGEDVAAGRQHVEGAVQRAGDSASCVCRE
jgi:hypothetical protein